MKVIQDVDLFSVDGSVVRVETLDYLAEYEGESGDVFEEVCQHEALVEIVSPDDRSFAEILDGSALSAAVELVTARWDCASWEIVTQDDREGADRRPVTARWTGPAGAVDLVVIRCRD